MGTAAIGVRGMSRGWLVRMLIPQCIASSMYKARYVINQHLTRARMTCEYAQRLGYQYMLKKPLLIIV